MGRAGVAEKELHSPTGGQVWLRLLARQHPVVSTVSLQYLVSLCLSQHSLTLTHTHKHTHTDD